MCAQTAAAGSASKSFENRAYAVAAPGKVAFQGAPGAYSNLACLEVFPDRETLPRDSFEATFAAVENADAALAMIPVENSVAGRVADIHHLMPHHGLHVIGEHYQPVHHHLLALPGVKVGDIKRIYSHVHALGQVRNLIAELGVTPVVRPDTAGSARELVESGELDAGVIASSLAAETYGLVSLRAGIEDAKHNTTRFLVMAREPFMPDRADGPMITSFIFKVRSVPAALYKAMGGFATNGINMTKLESYMVGAGFVVAQFVADVEGHPDDPGMKHAFEELNFFTHEVRILGVYPANPYRLENAGSD